MGTKTRRSVIETFKEDITFNVAQHISKAYKGHTYAVYCVPGQHYNRPKAQSIQNTKETPSSPQKARSESSAPHSLQSFSAQFRHHINFSNPVPLALLIPVILELLRQQLYLA